MAFQAVLSQRLAALADDLAKAAAADVEPLAAQVAELSVARDRYRVRTEELTAVNDSLSLELEARAAERESAANAVAALEAAREQAARLAAALTATESQYADLQRAHRRLDEELRTLRRDVEQGQRDRTTVDAALRDASEGRALERTAREAAEAEIGLLRTQLTEVSAAFEAQAAHLRQELADSQHASEGEMTLLREELAIARGTNREQLVARLGQVFDHIARGTSVEDVLGAAANGLADDFARVVVFMPHDERLEARYQRGFDPASGIGQDLRLGDGSWLAQAATTTELGLHKPDARMELPFSGAPSVLVTAPVVVRGQLLALIYADDEGGLERGESSATPARVADLIRRHTALRLDRLTIELKTIGELRAYARMLLDEVEYVYRADVSARKSDAERLERLTENLRCARQIFQQRVAVEGPAMAGLLEDVVGAAMAAKASTPFGRELASVASQAHPAQEAQAQ